MDTDLAAPGDPRALGARLQEARKARQLTQQQAADLLGVARTTLVAIEKGERHVQPAELVQLADLYGREVNDLLRRRTTAQNFAVQLRAVLAETQDDHIDAELDAQITELQRLCEDYRELEQLCSAPLPRRYPPEYAIAGSRAEQAAEDVASAERNRLGLGDGPLVHLRKLLENDVGLRIFYMPLPSRVAGMFGYTDDLGGCFAINAKHPHDRRRWSLAHEYAHFLTNRYRPDISIFFVYKRIPAHERFADAFARCFLMPASGLSRRLNALRQAKKDEVVIADLLTLADLYEVSFEALIRRMEELRLIAVGTWERLSAASFKVREAQALLGLAAGDADADDELLPTRYQYLAVEAYEQEQLTEGQLARFLRTDRLSARGIVHRLKTRPDVAEAGDVGELPIDFSAFVELT